MQKQNDWVNIIRRAAKTLSDEVDAPFTEAVLTWSWNNPFWDISYRDYLVIQIERLLKKDTLTEEEQKWLCEQLTKSL